MERIPRFIVLACWSLVAVSLSAQTSDGGWRQCRTLNPKSTMDQHALVDRSGCYTLGTSFQQGWLYSIAEGGRKWPHIEELVSIWAPDVAIDLAGHSLSTNTGVGGVAVDLEVDRGMGRANSQIPGEPQRLELRNGTIRLLNDRFEESQIAGFGVVAPAQVRFIHTRFVNAKPMPRIFPKVRYVLENLTIRTANAAAILMGDGVVIRNCTIEVEGENALVIYGPNAVIENNRIVFRHRAPSQPGNPSYPEAPGAIYLRAADNSVVRGNTIELDSDDRSVSAVAVVDSREVLVEGNHFTRDSELVTRRGKSTATFRNNSVKVGWPRKDRPLADANLE